MARLLIIGTLAGELGQAARLAQGKGAKLLQAEGVLAGLEALRSAGADLVFCDIAHDVAWLVQTLAEERIATPVIACGRTHDAEAALRAIRAGAKDFLPLPPDAELIAAMLSAVSGHDDAPVVQDPAMRALLDRATQIARSEASVLISGASGTGKEVMARHIHAASRRARGPFVALNVAALPESLLESELFGHEKGAFSGAVAARRGKFEQADRGTLLLDEIGEMQMHLQAKLLRAIQEREVDRLGGSAPVRIDVRILAATHRDLAAEVRAGRFREDLYFRLNVVSLRIPSLRERRTDILPLAEHFARRYAQVNGLPMRAISPAAQALLLGHPWPGNVRELENALHRAVLLAEGGEIGPEAIELTTASPFIAVTISPPGGAVFPSGAEAPPPGSGVSLPGAGVSLSGAGVSLPGAGAPRLAGNPVAALVGRRMDAVEQDLILETLGRCLGNRTRAAEILGISIRTLRNKLHEYRGQGVAVPPAASQLAPGEMMPAGQGF